MGTLTIVARRPDATEPLDSDIPLADERDAAIAAIMSALQKRDGTHRVMRASTVEHIRKCLQLFGDPPDLLQIVGHGMPGMLSLGAKWLSTIPDDKETYYLDSDPDTYAILAGRVAHPTEVYVLGCQVGASDVSTTAIPDGPVLLFDLCRMWKTRVSAPTLSIDDTNFSTLGLFTPTSSLATAEALTVTMPQALPPPEPSHAATERMAFASSGLATAPGFGVYVPVAVAGPELSREKFARITSQPILGMPELVVRVVLEGEVGRASMLANGRLLVVERDGFPTSTFEISDEARGLLFAARNQAVMR